MEDCLPNILGCKLSYIVNLLLILKAVLYFFLWARTVLVVIVGVLFPSLSELSRAKTCSETRTFFLQCLDTSRLMNVRAPVLMGIVDN